MDKQFYNLASAEKLGWEPDWFKDGLTEFDDKLEKAIRVFQRDHGLKADGMCGPTTYRRIYTWRESQQETVYTQEVLHNDKSHILYNTEYFPIDWPKVILPHDRGGLEFQKGFRRSTKKRKPRMFVTHWDVCLNAKTCFKVLNRRGLSIHFTIDNDGTIMQHMDLNHTALHAGSRRWNDASIGCEISNAYYPKYQSWYKKNVGMERPLAQAEVHGKMLDPFLQFYPVQLEALKALYKAVHEATGIPLETPNSTTVFPEAKSGRYKGYVSHFHLTRGKIDCAGLNIKGILEDIKREK